jgi:hypothetical protein
MAKWNVEVLVKRMITIVVEANAENEAYAEAMQWHVVGPEVPGDTLDIEVTRATRLPTQPDAA